MKVVLFCGGQGMRLRDYSETIPKPMVQLGDRPILLHLMKYYAHYGHKDFILCLGYKADVIKNFFLDYKETTASDFILSKGGRKITVLNSDIEDWKIHFVDTGLNATVGERLKAVEHELAGEEMFLANYADGLTDLDLNRYIDLFKASGKIGGFLAVRPHYTLHVVNLDGNEVTGIGPMGETDIWVNGGYFVFRREIFDYLHEGEELVMEPFRRLIAARQLMAHRYDTGFWAPMDTFKDKQHLDDLFASGHAPWVKWQRSRPAAAHSPVRPVAKSA